MILMKVAQVGLLGFERHTFTCSECHDVKWGLVFIGRGWQIDTEPLPVDRARPVWLLQRGRMDPLSLQVRLRACLQRCAVGKVLSARTQPARRLWVSSHRGRDVI